MGCSESKEEIQLQEEYRRQLKNLSVLAALESLQRGHGWFLRSGKGLVTEYLWRRCLSVDFRDPGLRFYRVFSLMDVDGSHAIDLDEFHVFFHLPRTKLSDQIFSALGHQSASRDVTFDDFVLNIWNFCTMSSDEIREHVFHLYDDDHSGTLDAAECESLFRLLYNTNDLSPKLKQLVVEVDTNGDGVLDKNEFAMMCAKNKTLLRPILDLQARAQQKCLGTPYWAKERRKRARILAYQKDVFTLARQRLSLLEQHQETPAQQRDTNTEPSTRYPGEQRASDRVAELQRQEQVGALESWIGTQLQSRPLVDQYLKAHCENFITSVHLTTTRSSGLDSSPETTQLVADLRHHLAVSEKRLEKLKSKLSREWDSEEAIARNARHDAVRATVSAVSAQALLKHAGKQDAASAMGSYLQKKLDAATEEVRIQFKQRWEMLDRATSLLADRALASAPSPAERMQQKRVGDKRPLVQRTKFLTRVVPVAPPDERWTEFFDATNNCPYYVSSLGQSTWERPAGMILQEQ